jgi:hypothetical protein
MVQGNGVAELSAELHYAETKSWLHCSDASGAFLSEDASREPSSSQSENATVLLAGSTA